jgi:hypothetical protein
MANMPGMNMPAGGSSAGNVDIGPIGHGMAGHSAFLEGDASRAQQIYDTAKAFFGGLTRETTAPHDPSKPDATHRLVPQAMADAYRAKYPGFPVPRQVVFQGGTNPAGVLYQGAEVAKVGYGMHHSHGGGDIMQHVWFRGDLRASYSDTTM